MKAFEYKRPVSVGEAVQALGAGTTEGAGSGAAKISAGGTDLLGTLREKIQPEQPGTVVSLKGVPGMNGIEEQEDGLHIGAMARLSDIAAHPLVRRRDPALAEAAHSVASPQLRHMATIGGNLCQEPRCWYYRYPGNRFHCLRKGGALCNA
ncbi:MAG: FAD binding domain-containing protein, partial [Clostridiales Family XIII bacterium]|nr:FAD binding domain-containing protein [Clostridiales Family XIII bacterium]